VEQLLDWRLARLPGSKRLGALRNVASQTGEGRRRRRRRTRGRRMRRTLSNSPERNKAWSSAGSSPVGHMGFTLKPNRWDASSSPQGPWHRN